MHNNAFQADAHTGNSIMATSDIAESDVKVNSDFFEILHLEDLHKPILQVVKHLFQV